MILQKKSHTTAALFIEANFSSAIKNLRFHASYMLLFVQLECFRSTEAGRPDLAKCAM